VQQLVEQERMEATKHLDSAKLHKNGREASSENSTPVVFASHWQHQRSKKHDHCALL